jgi:polyisoprenoid-binding protein YceI
MLQSTADGRRFTFVKMRAVEREDTMKRLLALIVSLVFLAPLSVLAQTYNVEPARTTIQFKVKNMGMMNVKGAFEKFKGTVDINEADITKSKVNVSIETTSLNTGIGTRDNHLRGPDFFEVVKFPAMTFVSTAIEAGTDKDKLKVIGNLTIKGVTKQVTLTVDEQKDDKGGLKRVATTSVNRQDFGVSWGAVISDEVFITITTELVKQ